MGEAFLTRKGGASFRSLYAARNPDKMEYTKGQYPDVTGAIIGAKFGTIEVPLHESAWTYINNKLMPEDPNIHITAQIGRYTKTLDIPVTVINASTVLNDCSWETIAEISAAGRASEFWNIGDIKYFEWQGNQIAAKIIGFDHDDLYSLDPGYNNPNYNGGSNKAGITFQWFTQTGTQVMHTTTSEVSYEDTYMRTYTMPAYFDDCPQDLQAAIRTVWIYSMDSQYGRNHSGEKLFLLNLTEYGIGNPDTRMKNLEEQWTPAYEYYQGGGVFPRPDDASINARQWTRSKSGQTGLELNFFAYWEYDRQSQEWAVYEVAQTYGLPIFPAFCV